MLYIAPQKEKETFTHEDYARTEEMNNKLKEINNEVRTYLLKLDVIN